MPVAPLSPPVSAWWLPRVHSDRRPLLLARNRIQGALRAYFADRDFIDVDTAALQRSPGNEAHLHAFETTAIGNDGVGAPLYLHTSPEFAMKKLLASGEKRISTFAHVYRNRERGPLHHPEFTMLEWYRAGESYEALMEDCVSLLAFAAEAASSRRKLSYRGRECDPFREAERVSVSDAFARYADIDLMASIDVDGRTDADAFADELRHRNIAVPSEYTWSYLFTRVLVEKIEPNLGLGRPTILDRYPSAEAALARPAADDARVAERFEVYACGVELANGFGELIDAGVQRERLMLEMDEKQRIYGERYPLDEEFLAALAIMPEASGIALGFDRLVMLATGAPRIDHVMWAPVPETSA